MTGKRKPYKTYAREFKVEAVRLMDESGRPPADIAMELGIRRNQLYTNTIKGSNKGVRALLLLLYFFGLK